jgi:hypothetical protein
MKSALAILDGCKGNTFLSKNQAFSKELYFAPTLYTTTYTTHHANNQVYKQ